MFSRRLLSIKKHSMYVVIFKHCLPIFAFLLMAVIAAWPTLIQDKEKLALPAPQTLKETPNINMEQVRFFAQDPKHKKITTTANKIIEIDVENNVIRLEKPVATYLLNSGETITAKSPYGLAYQNDKYMFFEDRVSATTDTGYTMQSSQVTMTYDGVLDTNSPVSIKGPAGTLNAQGVHMINKGANIHFKKKTTVHMNNNKQGQIVIISQDGMDVDRTLKTVTAQKDVHVKNDGKTLTADHIVLYYIEGNKTKIDHIEATGHVVSVDGQNKITADKMIAYYNNDKNNQIRSIKANGHVVASNPKNKITGNSGEYIPTKETITMFGDVVLHQGKSFIKGTEAWLNMATGDSNLKNNNAKDGEKKGRVTGTFMPQKWIKH